MRLLVTGATGQLGWELARSLVPLGEVAALTRDALDLADLDGIAPAVRERQPTVIVNAAAYTAVDRAESEEPLATRVNGEAVGVLAEEARRAGALLVHFSTDYVFDGRKNAPYSETDRPAPLNAYGRSKLYGEDALRQSGCDWLAFRTTWVYGSRGNNFLQTMLRLAAERETLRVVADQRGAPTNARFLADATAHAVRSVMAERRVGGFASGLFHLTADGETTWHGFAGAIVDEARAIGRGAPLKVGAIDPIGSDDYKTAATRPKNSMLDNTRFIERFDLRRPAWQDGMKATLQEVLAR